MRWILSAWLWVWLSSAVAQDKIAVLDVELNDISAMPNTAAEIQRTAEFAPLLKQALARGGQFSLVEIAQPAQRQANHDYGFLYQNPDAAAALAKTSGADWVVTAQHSKPSFLFSHLWANLVEVKTGRILAQYNIELKGTHRKVSERSLARLAEKVTADVVARQP
jgi:Protein of unknown function (DUF2380)